MRLISEKLGNKVSNAKMEKNKFLRRYIIGLGQLTEEGNNVVIHDEFSGVFDKQE